MKLVRATFMFGLLLEFTLVLSASTLWGASTGPSSPSGPPQISLLQLKGRQHLIKELQKKSPGDIAGNLDTSGYYDLGATDMYGRTALIYAVLHATALIGPIVARAPKWLVAHADVCGRTALHYAAARSRHAVKPLLEHMTPQQVALEDNNGNDALKTAAMSAIYSAQYVDVCNVAAAALDILDHAPDSCLTSFNQEGKCILSLAEPFASYADKFLDRFAAPGTKLVESYPQSARCVAGNCMWGLKIHDDRVSEILRKLPGTHLGMEARLVPNLFNIALWRFPASTSGNESKTDLEKMFTTLASKMTAQDLAQVIDKPLGHKLRGHTALTLACLRQEKVVEEIAKRMPLEDFLEPKHRGKRAITFAIENSPQVAGIVFKTMQNRMSESDFQAYLHGHDGINDLILAASYAEDTFALFLPHVTVSQLQTDSGIAETVRQILTSLRNKELRTEVVERIVSSESGILELSEACHLLQAAEEPELRKKVIAKMSDESLAIACYLCPDEGSPFARNPFRTAIEADILEVALERFTPEQLALPGSDQLTAVHRILLSTPQHAGKLVRMMAEWENREIFSKICKKATPLSLTLGSNEISDDVKQQMLDLYSDEELEFINREPETILHVAIVHSDRLWQNLADRLSNEFLQKHRSSLLEHTTKSAPGHIVQLEQYLRDRNNLLTADDSLWNDLCALEADNLPKTRECNVCLDDKPIDAFSLPQSLTCTDCAVETLMTCNPGNYRDACMSAGDQAAGEEVVRRPLREVEPFLQSLHARKREVLRRSLMQKVTASYGEKWRRCSNCSKDGCYLDSKVTRKYLACRYCGKSQCFLCGGDHAGDCETYLKHLEQQRRIHLMGIEPDFASFARKHPTWQEWGFTEEEVRGHINSVRGCPHCGVSVFRFEGCNAISCTCGKEWSWNGGSRVEHDKRRAAGAPPPVTEGNRHIWVLEDG